MADNTRGDITQESGEDGRTRFDRKQFEAALGGTQSDPNGTKVQSGWRADPTEALGSGSDQGQGAKKQTGSRVSDLLSGKQKRER